MTPLQLKVLDFVRDQLTHFGLAPTLAEIGDHARIAESNASRTVEALVRMGALRRTDAATRNIALVDRPDLRLVPNDVLHAELARRGATLEALTHGQRMAYGRRRACAVDGCGHEVQIGHLMCRGHWWRVPAELQDAIKGAHRRRDQSEYQRLVTEARDLAGTFVHDGRDDVLPQEADLVAMRTHIDALRPVTATAVVFAPTAYLVRPLISVTPDTPAVRAAIAAELADLFRREAEPGGVLLLSRMNEAISLAAGEYDHVLLSPAGNVVAPPGYLPVLAGPQWA